MRLKIRTKPVYKEAIQWTGNNEDEVASFIGQCEFLYPEQQVIISTLEGDMKANKGDFIIKGLRGEFYPCKPDVFYKTYEIIEGE